MVRTYRTRSMSCSDIESSATTAINRRSSCHSGVINRCCWATGEACGWGGGGGGALCDGVAGDAAVGCCGGESNESGENGKWKCEMHGCDERVDARVKDCQKWIYLDVRSWLQQMVDDGKSWWNVVYMLPGKIHRIAVELF